MTPKDHLQPDEKTKEADSKTVLSTRAFLSTMTVRYVSAIVVLALLSISAYYILHKSISEQQTTAAVVNLSGRQRMLSQRIALFAVEMVNTGDDYLIENRRQHLREYAALMERSHKGLINGDPELNLPGNPSHEARKIYFDPPVLLDSKVRRYIDETWKIINSANHELTIDNPHLKYMLSVSHHDLLKSLDIAVKQYQKESESDIAGLQLMESLVLIITLFVLFVIALFVFRPMVRQIRHEMYSLISAEQGLSEKNVELERANLLKSEFLANISHELRTPLNAIIGFSELLKDEMLGELEEKQKEYVTDIFNSGQHLLALINDILDLSKVEAGKMEVNLEMASIPDLLKGSLAIVRERADSKNMGINLVIADDIEPSYTDVRKFKQIVYNLLSNAVKFTPEGGSIEITAKKAGAEDVLSEDEIEGRKDLAPGRETLKENFIEIRVTDTGIGISKENLEKIFRPFEQLDGSLSKKYEGTGLGLVLVKRMVELMEGKIAVSSEEGKGSSFTFWLPLKRGEEAAIRTETGHVAGTGEIDTPDMNLEVPVLDCAPDVLIVEDSDKAFKILEVLLSNAGFKTFRCVTAEMGLEILSVYRPKLIILDILLPGMDGWEFLQNLQRDRALSGISVIILSITDDGNKGFALGASQVIQKPVRKEQLLSSIREVGLLPGDNKKGSAIMVVDDDPKAVELVSKHLEEEGFPVVKAYGGKEAIDRAKSEVPGLIILDLMMPEINGFDVVHTLKARAETRDVPIIILTAKIITKEDRLALNGGVEKIVRKSDFEAGYLIDEVRRLIS